MAKLLKHHIITTTLIDVVGNFIRLHHHYIEIFQLDWDSFHGRAEKFMATTLYLLPQDYLHYSTKIVKWYIKIFMLNYNPPIIFSKFRLYRKLIEIEAYYTEICLKFRPDYNQPFYNLYIPIQSLKWSSPLHSKSITHNLIHDVYNCILRIGTNLHDLSMSTFVEINLIRIPLIKNLITKFRHYPKLPLLSANNSL